MMRAKLRIAVIGGAGYVGGELLRLLLAHPARPEVRAFSASHAGERIDAAHPALLRWGEVRFEEPDPAAAAGWADVVFLAQPHGRSQQQMPGILAEDPRLVVDLGADFRLDDPARYAAAYERHTRPDLMGGFRYGLADVLGDELAGARRVAAPGCFATACLLALAPLARRGLIDGAPTVFAVTGSTGAGTAPRRTTHHPVRAHSFFGYARTGHRHEAEIAEQLCRWRENHPPARLLVHSAPLVRGIYATLHARLADPVADPLALYRADAEGRPFLHAQDQPPELAAVVGTNDARLHVTSRESGREVVVDVAIDNLVKGAAGQAVQCLNLSLGLPETAGLEFGGLYPC